MVERLSTQSSTSLELEAELLSPMKHGEQEKEPWPLLGRELVVIESRRKNYAIGSDSGLAKASRLRMDD